MGWIEDSIEEFRKLPPAGKLAVGGVTVGVVILAIAQARSSGSSATSASPANTTATTTPTGAVGTLPSLTTGSPTDWANWFNAGLSLPSVPTGAMLPTLPAINFGTPPAAASTSSGARKAAAPAKKVTKKASAKPSRLPNINNPTAAQTAAHRGTTSATAYNTAQQTRLAGALASR